MRVLKLKDSVTKDSIPAQRFGLYQVVGSVATCQLSAEDQSAALSWYKRGVKEDPKGDWMLVDFQRNVTIAGTEFECDGRVFPKAEPEVEEKKVKAKAASNLVKKALSRVKPRAALQRKRA